MRKVLNFKDIDTRAKRIASFIENNKLDFIHILTRYETYEVAEDEISRTLDLLTHLSENAEYFKMEIKAVAAFLPRNQPLYAFTCFAIVPSFMAEKVFVKAPEVTKYFFRDLLDKLNVQLWLPNIYISEKLRSDFVAECSATKLNIITNEMEPVIEAVIFTGTRENADKLRKVFSPRTLFISNGAGHNPIVITETADLERAIDSVLRVQLYNQGQDCAAPNSILVHKKHIEAFLDRLRESLSLVKVGPYSDSTTRVGPMTKVEDFPKILKIVLENFGWVDAYSEGVFRVKSKFIEPLIVTKPLSEGGNYTETFAPIFFVQEYNTDNDLSLYFEDVRYKENAMYVTLFGESKYIDSLTTGNSAVLHGLHDNTTIIRNTDLHAPGVERGTHPYGGYGKGASSLSLNGVVMPCPTLPQRDIYDYIICGKKMKTTFSKMRNVMKTTQQRNYKQTDSHHWAEALADRVISAFPDKDVYTCAAGISPSGVVHFGNFRDVITSYAVAQGLKQKGQKVRLIFSWDDFDRFRKVPSGIDASFEKYIGMPLSKVPCPEGKYSSYAERFEVEFEASMCKLGIELEYRYQTKQYQSGEYDDLIIQSLQNREKIAEILLSFMTEKGKIIKSIEPTEYIKHYYPISVYSRFSGKDNTRVLSYDGASSLTYKCFDTGKTDTINLKTEKIIKLSWKVDWPMRWKMEGVVFEPGGHDHASPGGSYDVSRVVANDIFKIVPPVFQEYQFVGIQGLGSKMSGSKGNAVSPGTLLEIYTPELLKWMYLKKVPSQTFELSFGSEIYKQYSEFDDAIKSLREGGLNRQERSTMELAGANAPDLLPDIPFRQAVGFGQIVHWDIGKLTAVLNSMDMHYLHSSLSSRVPRARSWLETYNKKEAIVLLNHVNSEYIERMDSEQLEYIERLYHYLKNHKEFSVSELEKSLYDIAKDAALPMKENAKKQKAFFKDVYNLLIGGDTGPRLSTFLWATDRQEVLQLLQCRQSREINS